MSTPLDRLYADIRASKRVTRRLLDDWIPDTDRMGWWHQGSGMEGPGEPMTEEEARFIRLVEEES